MEIAAGAVGETGAGADARRCGAGFPSTLWSVVLAAGDGAPAALEALAERYIAAIYAFIRRSGRSKEDAEDLAQDFFAFLIESGAFSKANPFRGRFRAFLL